MKRRVAITGLGVISPLGNDVASFWQGIKNGVSGIGPVTKFDASRLEARIAAEVKGFDSSPYMDRKEARKMAVFTQYAVAAAVQAWRDAGLAEPPAAEGEEARRYQGPYNADRIATVLGNGIGGIEIMTESHRKLFEAGPGRMLPLTVPLMIGNEAAANVAIRLGLHGPAFTQVTACASSTDAIGQALDMIRLGRADVVVAGGTEATVTEFAMGGFCRLQALSTGYNDTPEKASRPFDAKRDGFVLGEGAAILILEDWDKAVARGARIHAELAGYGGSCDAYHITSPDPSGEGGATAVKAAIEDAEMRPEDIVYFNAHGTSTPINDPTETKMLKISFGEHAKKLKISSTKSMTGHMLGAAGAIEALVCVKAVEEGFVPPTINLEHPDLEAGCDLDYVPNVGVAMPVEAAASSSLGFGGHNGVLIVRKAR
ncbi:MAG TPA: beta-ketoacyl-ACP synthase II [Rectinemataceae bacterium]|nr:beta-ketoacyl-ACP synthase II [Rectinemataceae bacterium]